MLFSGVKALGLTGLLFQCLIWDSIENTNLPPFRCHSGNYIGATWRWICMQSIWHWDVLQEAAWCLGNTLRKVWAQKWIKNSHGDSHVMLQIQFSGLSSSATHYQVIDYGAHMLNLVIICSSHISNPHRNGLPSAWGSMSRLKSTVNFPEVLDIIAVFPVLILWTDQMDPPPEWPLLCHWWGPIFMVLWEKLAFKCSEL